MNIRNTVQLALFVCGINKEANTIQELAVLMPMNGNTTCGDLYDGKKVLKSLDIPTQKFTGLVTDTASRMVQRNGATLHCEEQNKIKI
jgi:hypothetical protein